MAFRNLFNVVSTPKIKIIILKNDIIIYNSLNMIHYNE